MAGRRERCALRSRGNLNAMPPGGGGEMIVRYLETASSKTAHRFEAGAPNIAGAIGLAAATDYIEQIDAWRFSRRREMRVMPSNVAELRGAILGQVVSEARRWFVMDRRTRTISKLRRTARLDLRGGLIAITVDARFGCRKTRASFTLQHARRDDRMVDILRDAAAFSLSTELKSCTGESDHSGGAEFGVPRN